MNLKGRIDNLKFQKFKTKNAVAVIIVLLTGFILFAKLGAVGMPFDVDAFLGAGLSIVVIVAGLSPIYYIFKREKRFDEREEIIKTIASTIYAGKVWRSGLFAWRIEGRYHGRKVLFYSDHPVASGSRGVFMVVIKTAVIEKNFGSALEPVEGVFYHRGRVYIPDFFAGSLRKHENVQGVLDKLDRAAEVVEQGRPFFKGDVEIGTEFKAPSDTLNPLIGVLNFFKNAFVVILFLVIFVFIAFLVIDVYLKG